MQVFGAPRDVWLESKPHAVEELGDGAAYDCDNPLAACSGVKKRIDYIFVLEDIPFVRKLGRQPRYKIGRVLEQDRGVYNEGLSDRYGAWAHSQVLERTYEICLAEEEALRIASERLGKHNRRLDGVMATYDKLLALAKGEEADALLDTIEQLEDERILLARAVRVAEQTYETCLGEDIAIELLCECPALLGRTSVIACDERNGRSAGYQR